MSQESSHLEKSPQPLSVSQSFPEKPEQEIPRDNILDTLETLLAADARIVAIEGPDGAGKTTLLSQFARRNAESTLCLFISSSSRWAYDISQLRYDLCNQLEYLLHGKELDSPVEATDALLGVRITQLRKRARRDDRAFYFIIDGLEEIPQDDETSRRLILNLLPLGLGKFRFLFSGPLKQVPLNPVLQDKSKSYRLTFLTLDETASLFQPYNLDRPCLEEFYRTSRGMPGYLASIRRILENEGDPASLAAKLPHELPKLFEIEWRQVDETNLLQTNVLAMLAHARRRFSTSELAQLLTTSEDQIVDKITSLPFVVVDHQREEEVRFVSESFRRFAAERLIAKKQAVHDRLIDYLLKNPQNRDALLTLPEHYNEAGRLPDLLGYLSPETFATILERSVSLKDVLEKADLGISAAKRLQREGDWLRFTLQRATISDFADTDAGRAQVRAFAALNDYETASSLAQCAIRQEERLGLLAAIARARVEASLPPDPEINEQIAQLHAAVDYTSLGELAEVIAADLVYSHPTLAIEAVEKAARTEDSSDNALDWAFARLAVRATIAAERNHQLPEIQDISARIKDPIAKTISTEVSIIFSTKPAAAIISQAEALEGTSERLFVLRQWLLANRTRADAVDVLDNALKTAIQATGYSPNAQVFREIASCLPFVEDEDLARRQVSIIDSQMGSLEVVGPTEEFVRLNLILGRTEFRYSHSAARNRMIDIYLRIDSLPDLATKAACMARLVASLARTDPGREFESVDRLHSLAQEDFEKCLRLLLESTAEQHDATKGIVRALARACPKQAIDVAGRLNTKHRRDSALVELINTTTTGPPDELDVDAIVTALGQITEREVRERALYNLVLRLAPRVTQEAVAKRIFRLFLMSYDIRTASLRSRCLSVVAAFGTRHPEVLEKRSVASIMEDMIAAWQQIDLAWDRIEIGFDIVADLAKSLPDLARDMAKGVSALRSETKLSDPHIAAPALASLSLAIRAYAGLLPRNAATREDEERLYSAIESVTLPDPQAHLWTELALRYYAHARIDQCRTIAVERIKPIIAGLKDREGSDRVDLLVDVAPALFVGHQATAFEYCAGLSSGELDRVLARICRFLLRKRPHGDPFDDSGHEGYDVTYEDVVDVLRLVERMDNDALMYLVIRDVVDSLSWPQRYDSFSNQQRAEIGRLLHNIAEEKFPRVGFIGHQGYKIATRAQINRVRNRPIFTWESLIVDAGNIPNVADRIYVLAIIGAAQKDNRTRLQLFAQARRLTQEMPTYLDKIERYEHMSLLLIAADPALSKELLKEALGYTFRNGAEDRGEERRSIVDIAYRIDPQFAASLASSIDDDPAKLRVRRQIRLLEVQRGLASVKKKKEDVITPTAEEIARAAWMKLASLNAGRSETVSAESAMSYLDYASKLPLSRTYPIFAWVVENTVVRFARTDQVGKYVLPIFQATILGAELALRAGSHAGFQVPVRDVQVVKPFGLDVMTVGPGQRGEGVEMIRQWMERHLGSELKVSEGFFGPGDLDILKLVKQVNPRCRVKILASKRYQKQSGVALPWEEAYSYGWRLISDESPPLTEIVIVGYGKSGDSPCHDRWWVGEDSGLELGTSWNSLGISKLSDIRVMSAEEARSKGSQLDRFLTLGVKEFCGQHVTYTTIILGEE